MHVRHSLVLVLQALGLTKNLLPVLPVATASILSAFAMPIVIIRVVPPTTASAVAAVGVVCVGAVTAHCIGPFTVLRSSLSFLTSLSAFSDEFFALC